MGKGFQNFMSKKDFHPSAWWNLKRKWECEQKQEMEVKRQEELRAQYEKEQDILNNKALLGDEKARLGLSFMYDAPTGMVKKKEEGPEPKFEWQRKYNAPREEWAKGNELIQDQPFGIQVRNVRCVKCRTWGHLNTDRECPLYGMSGNAEDPGYSNNPSDLIRQLNKERKNEMQMRATSSKAEFPEGMKLLRELSHSSGIKAEPMEESAKHPHSHHSHHKHRSEQSRHKRKGRKEKTRRKRSSSTSSSNSSAQSGDGGEEEKVAPPVRIDQEQLLEDMREEHNLRFKTGVLIGVRADEGIRKLTSSLEEMQGDQKEFEAFLKGMSEKKRNKILRKVLGGGEDTSGTETSSSHKRKKHSKKSSKEKHKSRNRSKERHHHSSRHPEKDNRKSERRE